MNECPHGLFDVCCTNYDNCSIDEPKKEWVGLTDDERDEIREQAHYEFDDISNAIEAKLKEKNNG